MPAERRGRAIRVMVNLVNWQQEEPTGCGGGWQPSMDGTSRVTGDRHARFREGLGVKFPGPTRRRLAIAVPIPIPDLRGTSTSRRPCFLYADTPETFQSPACSHFCNSKVSLNRSGE